MMKQRKHIQRRAKERDIAQDDLPGSCFRAAVMQVGGSVFHSSLPVVLNRTKRYHGNMRSTVEEHEKTMRKHVIGYARK